MGDIDPNGTADMDDRPPLDPRGLVHEGEYGQLPSRALPFPPICVLRSRASRSAEGSGSGSGSGFGGSSAANASMMAILAFILIRACNNAMLPPEAGTAGAVVLDCKPVCAIR